MVGGLQGCLECEKIDFLYLGLTLNKNDTYFS